MIYRGISEMVGLFGPATLFGTKTLPVELIRQGLARIFHTPERRVRARGLQER